METEDQQESDRGGENVRSIDGSVDEAIMLARVKQGSGSAAQLGWCAILDHCFV